MHICATRVRWVKPLLTKTSDVLFCHWDTVAYFLSPPCLVHVVWPDIYMHASPVCIAVWSSQSWSDVLLTYKTQQFSAGYCVCIESEKVIVFWKSINLCINPLWPSDTIWLGKSRSTLNRVMVYHDLNQCWLTTSYALRDKFKWNTNQYFY